MKKNIYTIGHSLHEISYFLELLNKYEIDCIVDVRSTPYSERASDYNRENIKKILKEHKKYYLHFGKEFGARRTNKSLYDGDGIVDFDLVLENEEFKNGINRIKEGLKKNLKIALMCSEKEPFDCHRFVLVSRGLEAEGIKVIHILADKTTISNSELENKLLKKYKLNIVQNSLFGAIKTPEELKKEALEKAYRKRNKDIGYKEMED